MEAITLVDGLILGVAAISATVGLWRGLVREVLGLLGVGLSVLAAWQFAPLLAPRLTMVSDTPSLRWLAASVALFVGCWMVCALLAWLIGKLVHGVGLAWTDRLLGAAFGILRGVLLTAFLVMLGAHTPLKDDPWWQQSWLIPPLEWVAAEAVKLAPAQWRDRVTPTTREQES